VSEKKDDMLVAKRVYHGPTQVIRAEQLNPHMTYRLYLSDATLLFALLSVVMEKALAKVQILSVKGNTDIKVGTLDLSLAFLGVAPSKVATQDQWYPHWTETALDAYTQQTYPQAFQSNPSPAGQFVAAFTGGVFETFNDFYSQAEVKQFSISNRKVICEHWTMSSPEFGGWLAVPDMPAEYIFSEAVLYADGRLAIKCEAFWGILNPKR
jgi:hypothetical protein